MRALIFAAGVGERMRPLTDHTPKPLLTLGGRALIDYHLEKLAGAGFRQVLINTAYLAEKIHAHCGDGSRWGLHIDYSYEGEAPLETGGAIVQARHWFKAEPFAMISADIFSALDYQQLADALPAFGQSRDLAHLWLTHNPPHHPAGDFHLAEGRLDREREPRLTFTGIGLAKPALVDGFGPAGSRFPLRDALFRAMAQGQLGGQFYGGQWSDVGTPERLRALDSRVTLDT